MSLASGDVSRGGRDVSRGGGKAQPLDKNNSAQDEVSPKVPYPPMLTTLRVRAPVYSATKPHRWESHVECGGLHSGVPYGDMLGRSPSDVPEGHVAGVSAQQE